MPTGRERISSIQEAPVDESLEATPDTADSSGASEVQAETADESPRETTLRAYKELQAAAAEGSEGEAAGTPQSDPGEASAAEEAPSKIGKLPTEITEPKKGKEIADISADDLDPELQPPERLSSKAKVIFNNLPKTLKREFHKAVKDVEAGGTKAITEARTEAQREMADARHIKEAVLPFAKEWADRGFTVPQGIMQLARAQQKLTDPKTKLQTYLALGQDLGIKPDHVTALLAGKILKLRFSKTRHSTRRYKLC
jgi:hypothetical protein